MKLALTADEKNSLLRTMHNDYAGIILRHIVNVQANSKVQHFEDIMNNNPILEDFYKNLSGLERIANLIEKKDAIRNEIQRFCMNILNGLKISADKSLGDYKDRLKQALGERDALKLFTKLLNNETYPLSLSNLLELNNENLLDCIDTIDIFLQLKSNVISNNKPALEARGYFYNSLNASLTNANRSPELEPAKPNISSASSDNNNNTNNNNHQKPATSSTSFSPRQFQPAPTQVQNKFPSSGTLGVSETNAFWKAVVDEIIVSDSKLFTALISDESLKKRLEMVKEFATPSALLSKDRFGNNALHIAVMFCKLAPNTNDYYDTDIINYLVKQKKSLAFEENNFGLKPTHLPSLYDNSRAQEYFLHHGFSSPNEKMPVSFGVNNFPRKPS